MKYLFFLLLFVNLNVLAQDFVYSDLEQALWVPDTIRQGIFNISDSDKMRKDPLAVKYLVLAGKNGFHKHNIPREQQMAIDERMESAFLRGLFDSLALYQNIEVLRISRGNQDLSKLRIEKLRKLKYLVLEGAIVRFHNCWSPTLEYVRIIDGKVDLKNFNWRKCSRIKAIKLDGITGVTIPKEIFNCSSTSALIIWDCGMAKLPDEIRYMKKLQYLDLSFNDIRKVENGVTKLKSLKILNFSDNLNLRELPLDMGNMTGLSLLNLQNTDVRDLPNSLFKLPKLNFIISDCGPLAGRITCEELEKLRAKVPSAWKMSLF